MSMSKLINQTLKVGFHRGNKRVWMQGKNLEAAGFTIGKLYTTSVHSTMIVLQLEDENNTGKTRKVSKKPAGGTLIPVIDMNSKSISTFFEGVESVDISFINPVIVLRKGE